MALKFELLIGARSSSLFYSTSAMKKMRYELVMDVQLVRFYVSVNLTVFLYISCYASSSILREGNGYILTSFN